MALKVYYTKLLTYHTPVREFNNRSVNRLNGAKKIDCNLREPREG